MPDFMLAIMAIPVVAIAGWAVVASAQAKARGAQPDPALQRRLDEMADAIGELRGELDEVAMKQETDRQLLEERLDSAERMLTRGRDPASPPGG